MLRGATELDSGPAGSMCGIPPPVEPLFEILTDAQTEVTKVLRTRVPGSN